jgi:propionate CoA-transferase
MTSQAEMSARSKILDTDAVASRVLDGSTIAFPGDLTIMVADALLAAIEKRFLESGRPRNLTVFEPCNAVLGPGTGVERLAHEGLAKRLICSAFPTFRGGRLSNMINDGGLEAYNFPMGVLYSLLREIGAGRPGLLTEVGLDTFVDPTQLGGKLNDRTTEDMVERVIIAGRDLLFYKAFPVDAVFLKATSADELGNLSFENEPLSLGSLSLAIAAKSGGGQVYAQVERIVPAHTIHPKKVVVPGVFVDGIVLVPDAVQSGVSRYDATITGDARAAPDRSPVPMNINRILLSRAASMLRPGWLVNLGVGIPAQLPRLMREAGLEDQVTFSTEHGAIGGFPWLPPAFGAHSDPEALLDPTDTFNFYAGGALDITVLGLAQADGDGNVNVSRFGGRNMGVGGFIDITSRTPRIVICGALTADGAEVAIRNGKIVVEREGKIHKLVPKVEQITLNGRRAIEKGQQVTMINERGVFELTGEGWVLTEIMPGIDPQKHIAPVIGFPLRISPRLKLIQGVIMGEAGPAYSRWLQAAINRPAQ